MINQNKHNGFCLITIFSQLEPTRVLCVGAFTFLIVLLFSIADALHTRRHFTVYYKKISNLSHEVSIGFQLLFPCNKVCFDFDSSSTVFNSICEEDTEAICGLWYYKGRIQIRYTYETLSLDRSEEKFL